jgi:hypothetical protein
MLVLVQELPIYSERWLGCGKSYGVRTRIRTRMRNMTNSTYMVILLQTEDKREKIQALSLAKEYYSMKLELLTNATVVDDAIRFVSDRSKDKENLKSSATIYNDSEHDKEESDEPDHYEKGDQLEENQKEEADETTTNQIF